MRYSAAEDQLWHKHGRTVLHPKDAFDDAIRNGMGDEEKYTQATRCTFSSTSIRVSMHGTTECIGTSGSDISFYEGTGTFRAQW